MKIIAHIIYWIGIACVVALWATAALLICVLVYGSFENGIVWTDVRNAMILIGYVIGFFALCCLWQWAADRRKE